MCASALRAKPDVPSLQWRVGEVNGAAALIGWHGDVVDCALWLEADGDRVTRIDMVRNPEKLGWNRAVAG